MSVSPEIIHLDFYSVAFKSETIYTMEWNGTVCFLSDTVVPFYFKTLYKIISVMIRHKTITNHKDWTGTRQISKSV